VAVLDAATGQALATSIGGVGNDELLQGAVSPDERRLLVAYHQSGIRQYELTADGLRQCQLASPRRCLGAHGDFALYGDRVLTGGDDGAPIVEYGPDDQVRRRLDMGLAGNHMVGLAVDPAQQRLYVLGGCGYAHGLSAVSLRDTPTPEPPAVLFRSLLFGEPGDRTAVPCGARLAVGPTPLVVIGRLGLEIPEARAFGALLFVDVREARVVRTVQTPSEPVDVLVSPGP
jgi:hypothetical protein